MNSLDLRVLPSKVVFTIWLQQLIYSKRAKFSTSYRSVIELNSGICSMFAFGRHVKTNHPLIAAPSSLTPWFFMGGISRVIITKASRVYIEFGDGSGKPFYLCLLCSRKRVACLLPNLEITKDLTKTVDFHGYITKGRRDIEITKALNRAPIIYIDSFDEILAPMNATELDYNNHLEQDFDITDLDNWGKLKDPLTY